MNSTTKFIPEHVPSRQEMLDFVNGKLSAKDREAMQQLADNDPFIADAIEGMQFSTAAASLDRIDQYVAAKSTNSKWGRSHTWVTIGLVITAVVAIFWWVGKDEQTSADMAVQREQPLDNDFDRTVEEITEANEVTLIPEPSEHHVVAHKTTDSSVSITISHAEGVPTSSFDPYVFVAPLPEVEPEPVVSTLKNEVLPKRNSERIYHIEDYKVVDYRGKRNEEFKQWEVGIGGVPANMEHADQQSLHENMTVVAVPYVDYLEEAIVLFSVRKYKDCDKRMRTILKKYPDDINAQFYLGLALFNMKKYGQATTYFQELKLQGSPTFEQEINFYLAKSLCQSGEKQAGKALLHTIAQSESFYAQQAQHLLEELK